MSNRTKGHMRGYRVVVRWAAGDDRVMESYAHRDLAEEACREWARAGETAWVEVRVGGAWAPLA